MSRWKRFWWRVYCFFAPHYVILGYHTHKPIACTFGKKGLEAELKYEYTKLGQKDMNGKSKLNYQRVKLHECPICQKIRMEEKDG